jgi:hypothetical protein
MNVHAPVIYQVIVATKGTKEPGKEVFGTCVLLRDVPV